MLEYDYIKNHEYESLLKWFGIYLLFAVLVIGLVLLAAGDGLFQLTIHYGKVFGFVVIIAMPHIFINLFYLLMQFKMRLVNIILKSSLSCAISLVLLRAIGEVKPVSPDDYTIIIYALSIFACIMLLRDIFRNIPMAMPQLVHRVLLVGNGSFMEQARELIDTSNQRFHLVGAVAYPERNESPTRQKAEDIFEAAKSLNANQVVISLAERRGVFPLQEMLNCKLSGIEVLEAPSFFERVTGKLFIEGINPSWFIFSHGFNITPALLLAKRFADICCSLFGLGLCLPFAPLLLLAIKLDSPGPFLFRQERVGQGDKPFMLYKLRTMRQDAEQGTGAVWAAAADPRVTRLGRLLRASRIDEIPQFINVLRGEMSLVGPRPERPEFVDQLKKIIPYYSERHFVKPGVTGWAQVRYPYGASVEDALEKLRYDLYYIKHISLLFDLRIILKTVGVVLLRKGAR